MVLISRPSGTKLTVVVQLEARVGSVARVGIAVDVVIAIVVCCMVGTLLSSTSCALIFRGSSGGWRFGGELFDIWS